MNCVSGKKVLVTGSAGFIGFHLSEKLLQQGAEVLGVDNFTPYYDVNLKRRRTDILNQHAKFSLAELSIDNQSSFSSAWHDFKPEIVFHLAAQAGVRYSIDHPDAYISSNLIGTYNVLELARHNQVSHLLAASTSSVYGANTKMPFEETQKTATPLTLYAATKGATELMGHSYANLYNIPTTFFRFFTVYGPWGRPDMALFKFTKAMLQEEPIDVYNNGKMVRDFTYIDDLTEAIIRLSYAVPGNKPVANDSLSPVAPFRVVNIGQGKPIQLMDYIQELENALGITAKINFLPMQMGDVPATAASPELLNHLTGYIPRTPIRDGIAAFVEWYRTFYAH